LVIALDATFDRGIHFSPSARHDLTPKLEAIRQLPIDLRKCSPNVATRDYLR